MRAVSALILLGLILPHPSGAQVPVERVALGWAIDTTTSPTREIVAVVLSYYRLAHPGRQPTPLWSQDEQARFPYYDLTADLLYQQFPATIVEVTPVSEDSTTWVVKTLFARADSDGADIQPLGLQRLYARRTGDTWQLHGALAVLTQGWRARPIGRITYNFDPAYPFNEARAHEANRFVDSVAAVLGVAPPVAIHYYLSNSFEAMRRLQGFDWSLSRSMVGAQAIPEDQLLFCGSPIHGEVFRHELVHLVLAAYGPARTRNRLIEEGIATWLGGGMRGPNYSAYLRLLASYLAAHPDVTLRELLSSFGGDDSPYYATGAMVADVVFHRGGLPALQRLLQIGTTTDQLLAALPGELAVPAEGLNQWWRATPSTLVH